MIDTRASEKESDNAMLAHARAIHNAKAVEEVVNMAPYPEADGGLLLDKVNIERKWVMKFGGLTFNRDNNACSCSRRRNTPADPSNRSA